MIAKAVVFDFNGTLFFDYKENEEAWLITARHFINKNELPSFNTFAGMNDTACARLIVPEANDEEIVRIYTYKEEIYKELCLKRKLDVEKDAKLFIKRLNEKGLIVAIGSSAPTINFEWYKKDLDILTYFKEENIFYGHEELPSKPAPDLYRYVLSKLSVKGEEAICFEDAISGIRAALSTPFNKVYGIYSPGIDTKKTSLLAPVISWKEALDDFDSILTLN